MKLPPLLVYTVLRLLAFLVPLGVLLIFPIFRENWWLAILFATIIGMSISLLFLRAPLSAVSKNIHDRREAQKEAPQSQPAVSGIEEALEDAAVDAQDGSAATSSENKRPEQ